ncbi:MAG: hypothetical protein ACTHNK_09795 [Thermomicrobiales bacterium]
MKYRLLTVAMIVALLGLVLAPLHAAAAKPAPAAAYPVPVTGTFNGVFNLTGFANQGGQLVALGTLMGQQVAIPVDTNATTVSCGILHLVLGPVDLNVLGLTVHLNQVVLDVTAVPGPGNLLGNLLCSIAGLLDNGALLSQLTDLLNQLTGLLSAANLTALPATGTLAGPLNLQQFTAQNGQALAVGTLGNTGQQVALPVDRAASTGSCQILHLVLAPLDLNLLGLMVHLNQVVLDITAQSGPGNLLGNLLCTVAHLLDGPANINAVTNLLNRILSAL